MDVFTPVFPPMQLMKDVLDEDENCEILQTDFMLLGDLLLDITPVFQRQGKEAQEAFKIWLQLPHNSLREEYSILHRYGPSQLQLCLDCLMCKPGRLFKEIKEWKVLFYYLCQGLQRDFSKFVNAHQIVNRDPIPPMSAKESVQPLSKDEVWTLFRRIAFKDNRVPMEIEEYATNIADECNDICLAITIVVGKTRVDEWETSFSSMKNADPSFPDTLHPQLYRLIRLIRWSYDALLNSDIKNCFLYCAMYPKDEEIPMQELVRMWIAEGLVRSKQENYLMDIVIGHSYVNLLVDRYFFQNATEELDGNWELLRRQCIRVDDVIREMEIYIGEKEENCLFKEG